MNGNSSIHPRVVGGQTWFPKSNTQASPKRATLERKIASISAHLEEHPDNKVAEAHREKLLARLKTIPAA